MDVIDLIIVLVLTLGGWNGYRTGLLRQLTRLFGTVIAYVFALWLRPYVAPVVRTWLPLHTQNQSGLLTPWIGNIDNGIAFALVFIVSFFLLRYAAGLLDALFSLPVLSTVNRLAGLVVGLALAVVFVYVITLLLHYVNDPRLQLQLQNSTIVQWMDAKPLNLRF